MSGRHQPPATSRRLSRRPVPLISAITAITAVAAIASSYAVRTAHNDSRSRAGAASQCSQRVALNVLATPAIAAAVSEVAQHWGAAADPQLRGSCVQTNVIARADVTAEADLASSATSTAQLWIPDDTIWTERLSVDLAEANTASMATPALSIASSPLVIAQPSAAPGPAPATETVRLAALAATGVPQISLPNPLSNAEGVLGLQLVRSLVPAAASEQSSRELVGLMVALGRRAIPDVQTGFSQNPAGGSFVASEQAVIAADSAAGHQVVTAGYPDGADLSLDFPAVVLNRPGTDPLVTAAASSFARFLGSVGAKQILVHYGFRDPAGDPLGAVPGPGAQAVAVLPAPPADQTAELLRMWSAATEESHTLAVIDVSGSMADPAGNGSSKIDVAAQAAADAAGYFPDASAFGLWAFSSDQANGLPWTQLASLNPLGSRVGAGTQRQALLAAAAQLPHLVGGDTGLYDTALAAFEQVRDTYDPAKVNTVVLLTDGQNQYPQGLTLGELLTKLRALADPARPVPIITLGIGDQADIATLQQISAVTGGKTYSVRNPADIRSVFLDAMLQRECRPNCT